jgi:hypothetical protein
VQSPCKPFIEDYTEIFCMIDEEDVLSVQCKMNLRRPKSIRKVDGHGLIFIEFYVPALTPCLNSIKTSLQLSENVTFFVQFTLLYRKHCFFSCCVCACLLQKPVVTCCLLAVTMQQMTSCGSIILALRCHVTILKTHKTEGN